MKLADIMVESAIVAELESTDRDGVIKEMVEKLVGSGTVSQDDAPEIIKALIKREKQGSTGFGKGVAVPHVKHSAVTKLAASIGRSTAGIDFAALDREPVYIAVLLLSPEDHPEEHLQAMEKLFRHLQRDTFRKFLRQSETSEQIMDLVREAEEMPAQD